VERICTISSDSSSQYADSEQDELASHGSHSVLECTISSTTETAQSETVSNSATSLLSVLRRPTSLDLCRKRTIRKNPPKGKKCKASSSSCHTDPKSVSPAKRCSEFPDEPFEVSAGELFCCSCREELSLCRSIIKNHIASLKNKISKMTRNKQQIADKTIVESLKANEANTNPRGECLPEAQKVYHVKVVTASLKAGIPLAKLEFLRELLEEHAYWLTDTRGMFDVIPFIHSQEQQKIHEELMKGICL